MSITQLNELYMEMEVLIRELSETLITELALRDELEYEKEMKNSFISLLLAVQNKRRQFHVEKKRSKAQGKTQSNGMHSGFSSYFSYKNEFLFVFHGKLRMHSCVYVSTVKCIIFNLCDQCVFSHFFPSIGSLEPKYLTTVIPYHLENGTPDNQALQVLMKSKWNSQPHCWENYNESH